MDRQAISKQAVARNFSRAAGSYDAWADAQARIAEGLVHRLPAGFSALTCVDLGCGTGLLSQRLAERHGARHLIGVDLAEGMIRQYRLRLEPLGDCTGIVGDMEDPAVVDQVIHAAGGRPVGALLCASSSQWLIHPADTLRMWRQMLNPRGLLCVASMLEGSCPELRESYRQATGRALAGIRFLPADMLCDAAKAMRLRIICCEVEEVVSWYPNVEAALRSFDRIGASLRHQPDYVPPTAAEMRRMLRSYRQYTRADGSAPVSYRAEYLIAEAME